MKIKLPQGWSLIEKTETGSTNEDAKKLPSGSDKTAVCARIQTGGHGRMGRRWVSPAGNLYVSFCLEPVRPAGPAGPAGYGRGCVPAPSKK